MIKKPKVSLVVGHSKENPGAFAVKPISMSEYDYNINFAQQLAIACQEPFDVQIFFRDGMTITETYGHIAKWMPDFSLELHFNSHLNVNAFGTETVAIARNRMFAELVQSKMCQALNRKGKGDRGVEFVTDGDQRGYASVSRLISGPNCLIEPFFGSSENECKIALGTQENLCFALKHAMEEYQEYQ